MNAMHRTALTRKDLMSLEQYFSLYPGVPQKVRSAVVQKSR